MFEFRPGPGVLTLDFVLLLNALNLTSVKIGQGCFPPTFSEPIIICLSFDVVCKVFRPVWKCVLKTAVHTKLV
jgi:hypothetical protein